MGRAWVKPLWNGENTVMGVLISPEGLPVSDSVIKDVQQYIDPNDLGLTAIVDGKTYVVGDGCGNGRANIGAHFTAISAEALTVNIAFQAELASGRALNDLKTAVEDAITE